MDSNTYYFPNVDADDDLEFIARKAKEMMRQNDHVVEIFKINNEILRSNSPRQILFLMKQNKKSIFSPSSSNENSPSNASSPNKRVRTPIRCNPGTSSMPRRRLAFDDAEKKKHRPTSLEFSNPIGHQKPIDQRPVETILNPAIDKTSTSNEQFHTQIASTGSQESSPTTEIAKMTTNLTMTEKEFGSSAKEVGRSGASSQESSPTTEIAKMTSNLKMTENEFGSSAKEVGRIGASSQESSPTTEIAKMTTNLTMTEKELGSPAKEAGSIELRNEESPRTAQIASLTSSLTLDTKESESDDQMACNSATKQSSVTDLFCYEDSSNFEKNAGKLESPDSTNKYFISHATGKMTSESALTGGETPSPVKKTKMGIIPTLHIRDFASPAKDTMEEDSPEDTKVSISRIPDDKLNISPNERIEEIVREDRKRKSLSPRKRSTTPLKSIPKVVKLTAEEDIGIEIGNLDYSASPTALRSKSADSRSDSTKDRSIKSRVVGESKRATSTKTPELLKLLISSGPSCSASRTHSPGRDDDGSAGKHPSSGPSCSASRTHSPGRDDDVSAGKHPSSGPSTVATATRDGSSKFEYSSEDIEANPAVLKATIQNFNTLLEVRDKTMKNSFLSCQIFQTGVQFLNHYVENVLQILLALDISGKCTTWEFNEIVRDANAVALKLMNKFKSWDKDTDFDIFAWKKSFDQIEQLKSQYEPLLTSENEPAITFEAVQIYESEMRGIWKKMDGLVMIADSRRTFLAHIVHDVERFIKMIVRCLIIAGILQAR